jgi:hypothetical protein
MSSYSHEASTRPYCVRMCLEMNATAPSLARLQGPPAPIPPSPNAGLCARRHSARQPFGCRLPRGYRRLTRHVRSNTFSHHAPFLASSISASRPPRPRHCPPGTPPPLSTQRHSPSVQVTGRTVFVYNPPTGTNAPQFRCLSDTKTALSAQIHTEPPTSRPALPRTHRRHRIQHVTSPRNL